MVEFIYLSSAFLVIYNVVIYPSFMILISYLMREKTFFDEDKKKIQPLVTIVIAAYNEEKVIAEKIENTIALSYPKDKLEIILVCDGSDDRTYDIGKSYEEKGINAIHQPERRGKAAALNRAVELAKGEIVIFSDANNFFNEDSVNYLLRHFDNQDVGAVTGAKCIYKSEEREASVGDGLYWKYESALKTAESKLGSITGAEGEIFAVRKALYRPISENIINDDQEITITLVKEGFRVLYEPRAQAWEHASIDLHEDIDVKIRMASGGFQAISNHRNYLTKLYQWFPFTFFSHKILRYFSPVLLSIVFISNAFLIDIKLYQYVFLGQIVFYSIAVYGWLSKDKNELSKIVYAVMYYTIMNVAMFLGLIRYLNRSQNVNWKKARR